MDEKCYLSISSFDFIDSTDCMDSFVLCRTLFFACAFASDILEEYSFKKLLKWSAVLKSYIRYKLVSGTFVYLNNNF